MNGEGYDMDELIGKCITGEATEQEKQAVREWCALSVANQKHFDHAKLIYEKAQHDNGYEYDAEAAWKKVKEKITDTRVRKLSTTPVWRVAASLLLISVFSYFLYWQFFSTEQLQLASETTVTTQTLADNTEISLNKHSDVEIVYNERKKTGVIKLKGEASITIKPDKKVEWLVQTDELFIRDIGTTFNVNAYPDNSVVEVSVIEGEVHFYTNHDEGIFIKAGEKGLYDKFAKQFSKVAANSNVIAYKTLEFTFNDVALGEAVNQLSSVYNRQIVVSENLTACRLTVNFTNEDLETILGIIAETLTLTVTDTGTEIILSGDGCL
ncbi:MAG: FecR domain-containing protein [Cyclobacteriaceae bacterium]|nr:FecR domain-containing protein [Cyclobacteriaceae bacterium]